MQKRLIAVAVPIILILLILGVTFGKNYLDGKSSEKKEEEIQSSIKNYADAGKQEGGEKSYTGGTPVPSPVQDTESQKPEAASVSNNSPVKKKDFSKVSYDIEAQLGEMTAYWEDNNHRAIEDLAELERFQAMSYSLLGTKDYYYLGGENESGLPHGKGMAVFADNQYYYGEWVNGKREGGGSYWHFHFDEMEQEKGICYYHMYSGEFRNDLPHGEGAEHYEFLMDNLEEGIGYNQNIIGTYRNGLCDGEFYLTNIYAGGEVKEWNAVAKMGIWEYCNSNKDKLGRRPVQVETTDGNNYIWMFPKDNTGIGVSCIQECGEKR